MRDRRYQGTAPHRSQSKRPDMNEIPRRISLGAAERIPFNDLAIQWREIADGVRQDFEDVFATSAFCLGPQVDALEREMADYLEVPHVIGLNSGTSALHLRSEERRVGEERRSRW